MRRGSRVLLMAAIVALHVGCYWLVTRVSAARGPAALFDTATALDRLVPHLPNTWPLYWIAYPFVVLGASAALMQQRYHASSLIMPYATLPSMHVAYCTVAAGLLAAALPGRLSRAGGRLVVALVALSTLTLKEHVVLDVITGLALALATLQWWRQGLR